MCREYLLIINLSYLQLERNVSLRFYASLEFCVWHITSRFDIVFEIDFNNSIYYILKHQAEMTRKSLHAGFVKDYLSIEFQGIKILIKKSVC